MPLRANRPCNKLGCPNLNESGSSYCADHADFAKNRERAYKSGNLLRPLYTNRKWRFMTRPTVLARDPLCIQCKTEPATECDHVERAQTIVKRHGLMEFFNPARCQGLCPSCHSRKTALEVGFAGAHD